jgi:hypothetical protein
MAQVGRERKCQEVKLLIRHSGEGRNPAVLFNMPLVFVLATQGIFYNWIPAYAGMTKLKLLVARSLATTAVRSR